ncbi:MAG: hypothetical protein AAGB00_06855 [Planctomycetota bacterium]
MSAAGTSTPAENNGPDNNDADNNDAEPAATIPPVPPLRLHHVLAMTVAMTLLMGVSREWTRGGTPLDAATVVVWSMLNAVACSVVVFGCLWRRDGARFPSEPGHGLAILAMLNVLVSAYARVAAEVYPPSDQREMFRWVIAGPVAFGMLVGAVAALKLRRRAADSRAWRWVFVTNAGSAACYGCMIVAFTVAWDFWIPWRLAMFFYYASAAIGVAASLLCLAAVYFDWRLERRRSWSHWLVIATGMAAGVLHHARKLGWILTEDIS